MPPTLHGFDPQRVEEAIERLLQRVCAVPLCILYQRLGINLSVDHEKLIIRYLKQLKKYTLMSRAHKGPLQHTGGVWIEKRRLGGD